MKNREFAINIASDDQMDLAISCGNVSGRELDKFKVKDIPIRPAGKIGAPLIEGCVGTIECGVRSYFLTGITLYLSVKRFVTTRIPPGSLC